MHKKERAVVSRWYVSRGLNLVKLCDYPSPEIKFLVKPSKIMELLACVTSRCNFSGSS